MNYSTEREKELQLYIDGLFDKDGHLNYDLTDPKQFEFASLMAKKGFDTERYPGILKTLDIHRNIQKKGEIKVESTPSAGFTNNYQITGLSTTPGTSANIASNGLGTVAGGYQSLNLLLFVKDNATGNVVVQGSNSGITDTILNVATNSSSGNLQNVTAYMQVGGTASDGTPISILKKYSALYETESDPSITQPISYCTKPFMPNAINIAMGRPWSDTQRGVNFDYSWNDPRMVGKVPLVGSVTFKKNIQKPLALNNTLLLQINVTNKSNGGTLTLTPQNLAAVAASFAIDGSNPAKLNFTLHAPITASTFPNDPIPNQDNPILLSNVSWPSDLLALFYCSILVQLSDGNYGSAIIQSVAGGTDNDPLDGVLNIKPISFIYHCLAEDTKVTMADGSKKLIGDVVGGDKVLTGENNDVTLVEFTNKGAHTGAAILIESESGEKITASWEHIFMSAEVAKHACDLKVGDMVTMQGGESKVSNITVLPNYDGIFYNLGLKSENNKSNRIETFVANSFVVGDIMAQRKQKEINKNDINWVKSQLPEYLHTDVESFFEDNKSN
jgi:hypothetical protein